jgi:hypothetical protein
LHVCTCIYIAFSYEIQLEYENSFRVTNNQF